METASTTSDRYSRGAVVLHWLIALLIILNLIGAFVAEDLPKADKAMVMGYHKATGITILVLTLARIVWRLMHKAPPMVETLKAWEAALARVTHAGFYFLMLAVPLTGWAMSSAFSKGGPVSMFGLFDVPALPVGTDKPTADMFYELHEIFAFVMIGLFVLHLGAALKHHFVDKDGTMRRMVPWLK
ncbi:MAG: cytochrome b [Sphingomonadales bacterium]|nr:cytochrome b [Sphingomonadaceae bacterium]MBS3931237.1 cytochrome b [Sphingomonadales bacterium]